MLIHFDNSSDRLGYDGAGMNITKRYLSGTLNSKNGFSKTTALVGNTTAYDRSGNKFYGRASQAGERDDLYQPVDNNGTMDCLHLGSQVMEKRNLGSLSRLAGSGSGSTDTPIRMGLGAWLMP